MDTPDGFVLYTASAFASTIGPVFESRSGVTPVLGVRALPRHANSMGTVHGGLLLALADTALGGLARSLVGAGALAVTVDLQTSFMAGARIGQWIEVHPRLDRQGRSLVFTSGEIRADGSLIGRASATFFIHYRSRLEREAQL